MSRRSRPCLLGSGCTICGTTFGSRSAMAGVDLATLKELMGHSSITITMRYVHPTPAHKQESVRKLEGYNLASYDTKVPTRVQ